MYRCLLFILILPLSVVVHGEDKDVTMGGEFPSIQSCVATIEQAVGPLKISVDKPDKVMGTTREGKLFSCEKKETGTRGTYIQGWYLTKESS